MTFCNLHLYGIDRQTALNALADGDILREINAPWLAILPPEGETDEGPTRLLHMAKVLTKGNAGAVGIHFYYFDDSSFHIRVCREGRCVKTLSDDQSWAFLARLLAEIYDDDQLGKAFRHKNLSLDLEERLCLLEETVGTAFYDGRWAEPRRMMRGNAMANSLRERALRLRRLKNRYKLVPLPLENWPEYARACFELASLLPKTYEENYHSVLGDPYWRRFAIPHQPWWVAVRRSGLDGRYLLTLYDSRNKRLRRLMTEEKIEQALWMDRSGHPVYAAFGRDASGLKRVVCLDDTGSAVWSFAPPLDRFQSLGLTKPNPDGVLTILTDILGSSQSRAWQLDGETGQVVRETVVPWKTMPRVDALDGYVAMDQHSILLLDDDLEPRFRWTTGVPMRLEYCFVSGTTLWSRIMEKDMLYGFDLACGEIRVIRPELPVQLEAVLSDGTLAAIGMNTDLLLLDAEGRLASRHALEGWRMDSLPDGTSCVVETAGFPKNAFFTQQAIESLSLRAWAVRKL